MSNMDEQMLDDDALSQVSGGSSKDIHYKS